MKQLPIKEASPQQLAAFARTVQQIEQVPTEPNAIVGALVESGWKNDYILVDGDETADVEQSATVLQLDESFEAPQKMPATGFGYWRDSPMVVCRIMPTDRPGGNEPAHPSINGSPNLVIQRGALVEIPWDFYLVIRGAGGTKLLPGADAKDDLVKQDYSEYPLNDVRLPSRAAVEAWYAKSSKNELGKAKAA